MTPEKDYGMGCRNICLCISKCRPILLYVETQLLNNIAQPDRIALSQNVTESGQNFKVKNCRIYTTYLTIFVLNLQCTVLYMYM